MVKKIKLRLGIIILILVFVQMQVKSQGIKNCNTDSLIQSEISLLNMNVTCYNYQPLLKFLADNDPDSRCYFPSSQIQMKSLLDLIDISVERSKNNYESLNFVISLLLQEKSNVELMEHLSHKTPEGILRNVNFYMMIYSSLTDKDRSVINSTFVYLSKENLDLLMTKIIFEKSNLDKFKSEVSDSINK